MNEEILINITPQETRVAIILQGVVQELHIERVHNRGSVGNIYKGRICRVLPGIQSAFVEIGLGRNAFLHIADVIQQNEQASPKPIEAVLHEGQAVLVQVIKDSIGEKGARLSMEISLAGRVLVYLPQNTHIGVSQRIEDETQRELLRNKIQTLLLPDETGGFIARTLAESAKEEELKSDINYLRKLWRDIRTRAQEASTPALVYEDLNLAHRVLRDFVNDQTNRVLVDSRENYTKLKNFSELYSSDIARRLECYSGERPLFDLYGVEDEIEKALARRVDLKSGGYLIIDQTEAMTTIDVNTGGFVGRHNFSETIFKTNLEAAQAIGRQLRLRNLGGMAIVDFIDMDSEEHKIAVLSELNKILMRDRTRTTVNGFSALGLVEITRKRTHESLAQILCQACPTCEGRGEVKTPRTLCYKILREILREARQFEAREFRLLASQSIINFFLDEESQSLVLLSDFIGKPISLQAELSYSHEQFDIVLM